ncbi:MAG TPA: Arc family DNA-binding protein [Xanthobacteraceae bacterium]|nr:Arc family DNA-binding protein [Xanthobacteraceae bacterium]
MDSERDKYPSETAERFQVRLPKGLRDRIKAYAERHGRSMNTEIVRVLENEFPEPWSVETRIGELLDLVAVLKGGASNEAVGRLVDEVDETVRGMIAGRVSGLDEDQRSIIKNKFDELLLNWGSNWVDHKDLDEEERQTLDLTGKTQKFVHPKKDD